ncbi:MAG: PfkB family carbohydrate kinase [Chloroflexota bacterium]
MHTFVTTGAGPSARVTLVSTRTVDCLPEDGRTPKEVPGGPAHYIGTALDQLGCPFTLVTGEVTSVQVVLDEMGEDYLIPRLPLIPLPRRFDTEAVILSPIMQEVDSGEVPEMSGLLAIDLQGFVREPMKPFRDVTRLFSLAHLLDRAGLVKAGEAEVERLDRPSRRALDSCTTMVTRGSRGIILRQRGRERKIAVSRVEAEQTIGAGDTLLAAMVVGLLDGFDVGEAALRASDFASRSLREREKT